MIVYTGRLGNKPVVFSSDWFGVRSTASRSSNWLNVEASCGEIALILNYASVIRCGARQNLGPAKKCGRTPERCAAGTHSLLVCPFNTNLPSPPTTRQTSRLPVQDLQLVSRGPQVAVAYFKMSGLATKQQSLKIFEKLKSKPANKVSPRVVPVGREGAPLGKRSPVHFARTWN